MCNHWSHNYSRRDFLMKTSLGLGGLTFASLVDPLNIFSQPPSGKAMENPAGEYVGGQPHFLPKVKRVIYLFQSGAPSQLDLFDYKPTLNKMNGQDLPESVREGSRITGMSSGQ